MVKSLSQKVQRIEESQTLALSARANKLKRDGVDVCILTAGEPDFPTPEYIKEAGIRAIREDFTRYTNNAGIPGLLTAIAAKFKKENNLTFEPSQILVSNGAKHSVYNALQALCDWGDEVIIQAPYWVSYPAMAQLVGATPVIIETTPESNFLLTVEQLQKAITPKTKVLIFNSPNNPTGAVHTQQQIELLAEVARQSGIYVISDEIYEKIMYDGYEHFSMGSIPAISAQVVTVNGMSKAYAMTGWRIGYMGASQAITDAAAKVQSQVTSNASSISQRAAFTALTSDTGEIANMTTAYKRRRDFMVQALSSIPGVEIVEPKGAFYLFPSLQKFIGRSYNGAVMQNDVDLCNYLLNEAHLAVIPGSAFGAPGFVRISYACPMKDLEVGVRRLKEGLGKL